MVSYGPGLLPTTMSGSIAQKQPGSELMVMDPVTAEDCADTWGLDSHLRPGLDSLRDMLLPGPYVSG